jgi:putative nucleotidyltransferase with HDIG domain
MTREEALKLVKGYVPAKNLVKHMIATEGCMRRLAHHFGEDEEIWALAGLLHDLDYEETKDDFPRHGLRTVEILSEMDIDERVLQAIKAHPGHIPAETKMDWALYAVDPLTGLIVAATLMHPSRDLTQVDTEFVMRRFKEKRFAAGANREQIKECAKLALSIEEFIRLCLEGMREVKNELGL